MRWSTFTTTESDCELLRYHVGYGELAFRVCLEQKRPVRPLQFYLDVGEGIPLVHVPAHTGECESGYLEVRRVARRRGISLRANTRYRHIEITPPVGVTMAVRLYFARRRGAGWVEYSERRLPIERRVIDVSKLVAICALAASAVRWRCPGEVHVIRGVGIGNGRILDHVGHNAIDPERSRILVGAPKEQQKTDGENNLRSHFVMQSKVHAKVEH